MFRSFAIREMALAHLGEVFVAFYKLFFHFNILSEYASHDKNLSCCAPLKFSVRPRGPARNLTGDLRILLKTTVYGTLRMHHQLEPGYQRKDILVFCHHASDFTLRLELQVIGKGFILMFFGISLYLFVPTVFQTHRCCYSGDQ